MSSTRGCEPEQASCGTHVREMRESERVLSLSCFVFVPSACRERQTVVCALRSGQLVAFVDTS